MAEHLNDRELLRRISEYGYVEGGVQHASFSTGLCEPAATVVVALNNADREGALVTLYRDHAEELAAGSLLLASLHGAGEVVIHLPECLGEVALPLPDCGDVKIRFAVGTVNKRSYPGACYCHVVTAIHAAQIASGTYTDGIYAAVNGEGLRKYAPETTVAAVLEEHGTDLSHVSAILCGYRLCGADVLRRPLWEVYPENGNLTVISDRECVVSRVAGILKESYLAGCGKCVFCREGLNQLSLMVRDFADGKGKMAQTDMIREIAGAMKSGTLCSFGQNRGELALDLVNAFGAEVTKHIKRRKCTPGICFSNDTYYVDPTLCNGCGECRTVCPAKAIDGLDGYIHMIDTMDCTSCGKCLGACPTNAIRVTQSKPPHLPDRLTRVGHFKKI